MRPNLENSIVNSALWAAAADAIGWITELVDKKGVVRRTGKGKVIRTVAWRRKVGGIAGVTVELPAGTYSDDTQLRLAVCRSIQGDGFFDVEAFAKVELSTWASYALGGGRGTKLAASNIARRDVNWFSNFYSQGDQVYFQGGGNGAAMRIQPHVWRQPRGSKRAYLLDVLKDSLVTHGHMRGVCGAVFHADCLAYVLETGEIPGPAEWRKFIAGLDEIFNVVKADFQLGKFWLGAWEQGAGIDLISAISDVADEMRQYVSRLGDFPIDVESGYLQALEVLECLSTRIGTGTNTALAAAYLAWIGQDQEVEATIQTAVNMLGSDTDTIGTMVGALLGGISMAPPSWPIQDEGYIRCQAIRIARIAEGRSTDGYRYPDLMTWQPPSSQSNALQLDEQGRYLLNGFGIVEPIGKRWSSGAFTWEWFKISFGQTILCKHRISATPGEMLERKITDLSEAGLLSNKKDPQPPRNTLNVATKSDNHDPNLQLFPTQDVNHAEERSKAPSSWELKKIVKDSEIKKKDDESLGLPDSAPILQSRSIAELTDIVIKSNFDSDVLGKCFLECAAGERSIENLVAFSAIIGKAIDVRQKKKSI